MSDSLIDLIRHGEPEGGSLFRGHTIDDPLSEKGWQQMRTAISQLPPWQQIISSPMRRCQAFAEQTASTQAIPLEIIDDFREVGFGHWEGRTRDDIKRHDADEYRAFYRDPVNQRPAGAEPLDEFIYRVSQAYDKVLQRHPGKHTLIVAHAGVIRAIISHVLGAPPVSMYRLKINNAGITRIRHGENGGMVEFVNG